MRSPFRSSRSRPSRQARTRYRQLFLEPLEDRTLFALDTGEGQGILASASISGANWNDVNGNGQRDTDEPGLPGVVMTLDSGADGTIDATTITDANGSYLFSNLTDGPYAVGEMVPTGWQLTYPLATFPANFPFGIYQPAIAMGGSIRQVPADYPTIQAAINTAASGDTVFVSAGTYVENINFLGKSIVVTSALGPDVTIIDGNQAGPVATLASGESSDAVLHGFTLRNGHAKSGAPDLGNGGGIRISGSPTITNNKIVDNFACTGAGIYAYLSAANIQHNIISRNSQSDCVGGIGGGGITIQNKAASKSVQILDNLISDNITTSNGGGISINAGGSVTVRGNVIRGNTSSRGGGIAMFNDGFPGPRIVQNLIVENKASNGGGIFTVSNPEALTNNTIVDNDAPIGSGIDFRTFYVGNNVFNNIVGGKDGQSAVTCEFTDLAGAFAFKSNNVFNAGLTAPFGTCTSQTGLNGNISIDPLFVDPASEDYHLRVGSRVIDVGNNSATALPATDVDGNSRTLDGDGNVSATVDMGVDEFDPQNAIIILSAGQSRQGVNFGNKVLNRPPTITSNGGGDSASVSVVENTATVTDVNAADPNVEQTLFYSIVGGDDAVRFFINPTTGILAFITAPDFEFPSNDAYKNNIYEVLVQVNDGYSIDRQALTVTVLNINEPPTITSNGGGDKVNISINETPLNSTFIANVHATDFDKGQTVTYGIAGGADAGQFSINAASGVLTLATAPDFEKPADADGNNVYEVIVQARDGELSDYQTLAVTITNVNEAPIITSNGGGATTTISVPENSTAVTDVDAADPDASASLTYSKIGGTDSAKFSIDSTTGVLTFLSPPNFESPTDSGANNIYDVIIRVSDGSLTDTQTVAVTVTNVNESPTITSNGGGASAIISLAENTTAVTDVDATGAETGSTLTYSITGGADAARLSINSASGVLTFINAPDFENPTDVGGNNVYDVVVQASDGNLVDTQAIAVTVTDVADGCSTVVVNTNDSGAGSLREAINCASITSGTDTITFGGVFSDTIADVVKLTSGELVVSSDLTIQGPGASSLKLSGNNVSRVLRVAAGTTVTVTGLTIADGNGVGGGIGPHGGGVYNEGTLTLRNVMVSQNRTRGVGGSQDRGGGIENINGTLVLIQSSVDNNFAYGTGGGIDNQGGAVSLLNSTVSNNSCASGAGGIGNFSGGISTIINSTISGNYSGLFGGGIANSSGTLVVTNATITGNGSYNDYGGLYAFSSTTTLRNSIVAGNYKGGSGRPVFPSDIGGTITVANNNLIGDAGTASNIVHDADGNPATGSNNIVGNNGTGTIALDTIMGFLADNGGPTKTHDLVAGSLAIDRGSNALAKDAQNQPLTTDQRGVGFARIVNSVVDMGALEFTPAPIGPPNAVDDGYAIAEDKVLNVLAPGVLGNDIRSDTGTLTAVLDNGPQHGTLNLNLTSGSFSYSPVTDFSGTDSFTYHVTDGIKSSGKAKVTITVTAVNDPPSGTNKAVSTLENSPYVFITNDFFPSDSRDVPANSLQAVRIASVPATGSLIRNNVPVSVGQFISVSSVAAGELRYVPPVDGIGNALTSFTFQVQDNGGTANGGVDLDPTPNAITINVLPVNHAPVAVDDNFNAGEETPLSIPAAGILANDNDTDAGDTKTVVAVNAPAASVVRWDESTSGDLPDFFPAPPVLLLQPGANEVRGTTGQPATGPADFDRFMIRVPDGAQLTSITWALSRTVGALDSVSWDIYAGATRLATDSISAPANEAFDGLALPLGPGQYLFRESTIASAGGVEPSIGAYAFRFQLSRDLTVGVPLTLASGALLTVNANGSLEYDPNGQFESLGVGQTANDSFTYTMADREGSESLATAAITVHGANDAPTAVSDGATVGENFALDVQTPGVLANDLDVDIDDTTTVVAVNGQIANVGAALTLTSGALLTVQADGSYRYDTNGKFEFLAAGQSATDAFVYTMADSQGATSSATVTITIQGADEAPAVKSVSFGVQVMGPITAVSNVVYFAGNDGIHGTELWRSDGSAAGTYQVKDIRNGIASSFPTDLTNVNGTLFFSAADDTHGRELWKSDGTDAGTVLIKDSRPGVDSYGPESLINVNGRLFFALNYGNGTVLWTSDGTSQGTSQIGPGNPRNLTAVNSTLFFEAQDANHGFELWKSDGTSSSTMMVKDIWPGTGSSSPEDLTNVGGQLFFRALDEDFNYELWKSDGTEAGTVRVKDLRSALDRYGPQQLTDVNGTAYFIAQSRGGGCCVLGKSDGTEVGTTLYKNVQSLSNLTEANGLIFFTDWSTYGPVLWKSDGTEAGTVPVTDPRLMGSSFTSSHNFKNVNGKLYFSDSYSNSGDELWLTDGTLYGTVQVADITPGPISSYPYFLTNANGALFFSANDGVHGRTLWTIPRVSNTAPVAKDDTFDAREDTLLTISSPGFLANDTDTDGDLLTAVLDSPPSHGTASLDASGRLTYSPSANYNGSDSFTYHVSDGIATSNVATISLNVAAVNDRPVVVLGGDVSLSEGQFFVVNGSFSDPDSGETWTARVNYGDGSGEQFLVLLANKTFQVAHTYADNGSYPVTVSVRDSSGLSGSAAFRAMVQNVAPQNVAWNGPLWATRGQSLKFVGGFSDSGVVDTQSATVDWGDLSSGAATVAKTGGAWQVNAAHKYASGGIFQAALTIKDDDGGIATQATTVMVVGARLNGSTFELVGSAQRDNIKLSLQGNAILVNGTLGSAKIVQAFPLAGVQNIVTYLGEGNDTLTVDAKVKFSLLVNAGGGNDVIQAGGGAAVLIGGLGQDQLTGGGKNDLLIAGTTAYDNRPAALGAILAEWSSGRPLAERMANLRSGAGPVLSGLDVALKAKETVFDDAAVDKLLGGTELDWYWCDLAKDKITGKAAGETVN